MPRTETEIVEGLDTADTVAPQVPQLFEKRWKNFETKQARFPNQKVLIQFYRARIPMDVLCEELKKALGSNIYPATIELEQGVEGLGGPRPKSKSMGGEAITVIWKKDLPDAFLKWVKSQLEKIDNDPRIWRR